MSTHKTNENMPDCELHDHNYSIFVAANVKDIMLIPNVVCCREVSLYIRQVLPLCLFCDVIPSFYCSLSISMSP